MIIDYPPFHKSDRIVIIIDDVDQEEDEGGGVDYYCHVSGVP